MSCRTTEVLSKLPFIRDTLAAAAAAAAAARCVRVHADLAFRFWRLWVAKGLLCLAMFQGARSFFFGTTSCCCLQALMAGWGTIDEACQRRPG